MIKVLHTPLMEQTYIVDGEERKEKAEGIVKYALSEDDDGIELSFTVRDQDVVYRARMNYAQYAGKIIEVALVTTDKVNDLKIYPVYDTVVRSSYLQNRSVSDMRIARIVFDDNCKDNVLLLCKDSDDIPGFENIVFDSRKESAAGVLALHSNYFADKLRRRKIKAEMIHEIDIYATITYLEAQVDVLTRIVLSLAPESEYKDLLQIADRHSVLAIKSKEAMVKEFERDKQSVRRLQGRYYDAKTRL